LSTKLVSTFAVRGCRVISATDLHGLILGFLDRGYYFLSLHRIRQDVSVSSADTGIIQRSRYSDWLRVGRHRGRSSNPGRIKNFLICGPPNLLCNEYRGALSAGVKRPRRESVYFSPTNAEIKRTWICTCTSRYVFMA
jgi:hypothetical protein